MVDSAYQERDFAKPVLQLIVRVNRHLQNSNTIREGRLKKNQITQPQENMYYEQ